VDFVDLRSDTVTTPTHSMRKAMAQAEVGDEGYKSDPTVIRLEELAADMVGTESAVFCVSGTMANLLAVMCHTSQGDEIVCERESHLYWYESSGLSLLPGVQVVPVIGRRFRQIEPEDLRAVLKPVGPGPARRLLCLENSHNRAGGTVMSVERTAQLCTLAREHGMAIHLDGARIFNAALASGVDVKKLVEPCDSVMFCLSKGLGAPMGSMLCGTQALIEKARAFRKAVGGRLRQSGVVAAAGIVGLTTMVDRLVEDHENAKLLARGIAGVEGLTIDLDSVQTNIVMFEVSGLTLDAPALVNVLAQEGILCTSHSPTRIRMVTHKDVARPEAQRAVEVLQRVADRYRVSKQ
jgi:threonine aldolase